jgi:rhamnosyltransferase
LFDQDSVVTDGFIAQMLVDYRYYSEQRNIIQIVPRYKDPETGLEKSCLMHKDGGPFMTITSGSFFPARAFDECGFFTEELFVYCVDDDFSLRLRSRGFSIAQSRAAVLRHHSGRPSYHKFLGMTYVTSNYRPESRYYWMRNRVWMLRRYGFRFPMVTYHSVRAMFTVPLKVLIFEQSPSAKMWMFLRGFRDGVVGRMGKVV